MGYPKEDRVEDREAVGGSSEYASVKLGGSALYLGSSGGIAWDMSLERWRYSFQRAWFNGVAPSDGMDLGIGAEAT